MITEEGSEQLDRGTVQLDLQLDKEGNFSGEIETTLMGNSLVAWSRVMAGGYVSLLGGFDGEVWDIQNNRRALLGYFHLSTSDEVNEQAIQFSADSNFSDILPSKTILWRTDAKMSDGQMGTGFRKLLMRAANEKTGEK